MENLDNVNNWDNVSDVQNEDNMRNMKKCFHFSHFAHSSYLSHYFLLFFILMIMTTACSSEQKDAKFQTQDALENILSRKSVRKYLAKPVEKEKLELILKAGMAAPSGKDVRPWELIVIDDRSTLDSMAEVLPYAKMLKQAPMAIVVCGDTTKSSYWYLDCSAVTQNILLAAEALGLGAVWTATYPYPERMEVVKKYTALPDEINSLCVIPVGYPAMPHSPKDKWDASRVHHNKY